MGLSENRVNLPNEIAIFHRDNDQQNHWVQWGTQHFQTNPNVGHTFCQVQLLGSDHSPCWDVGDPDRINQCDPSMAQLFLWGKKGARRILENPCGINRAWFILCCLLVLVGGCSFVGFTKRRKLLSGG